MQQVGEEIELLNVDDVVIYDNDIDEAIHEACIKFKIENLKMEGQRPWKAVLQYVGKKVFPDKNILKSKVLYKYNNNNIPTTNNSYNHELINNLCDYYIMLSDKYNKLISTVAFGYFINIPKDTIDEWKNTELNSLTFRIWKKLQENREDCLKDKNYDSNNVVGAISIGNTEFGWNMPGVSRESTKSNKLSLEDLQNAVQSLPDLSTRGEQK